MTKGKRTGIFQIKEVGYEDDFNTVREAKKAIENYLLSTGDHTIILYRNNKKYGMYWLSAHTGKLGGMRFTYD